MNSKYWAYLFFACLLTQLAAIAFDWTSTRFITKPFLMAILFVWFIQSSPKFLPLRNLVAAALLFSWAGDVFLLKENSGWFMAGLGSFLLAHGMYILFFMQLRRKQIPAAPWNIYLVAIAVLYAITLYVFLFPHVGNLKIPVGVYAVVITLMLITATHAVKRSRQPVAVFFTAGALLFVLSDSLLAINRFYRPLPAGDAGIMLTYGIAQFAIIKGSLLYLAAENNNRVENRAVKV